MVSGEVGEQVDQFGFLQLDKGLAAGDLLAGGEGGVAAAGAVGPLLAVISEEAPDWYSLSHWIDSVLMLAGVSGVYDAPREPAAGVDVATVCERLEVLLRAGLDPEASEKEDQVERLKLNAERVRGLVDLRCRAALPEIGEAFRRGAVDEWSGGGLEAISERMRGRKPPKRRGGLLKSMGIDFPEGFLSELGGDDEASRAGDAAANAEKDPPKKAKVYKQRKPRKKKRR